MLPNVSQIVPIRLNGGNIKDFFFNYRVIANVLLLLLYVLIIKYNLQDYGQNWRWNDSVLLQRGPVFAGGAARGRQRGRTDLWHNVRGTAAGPLAAAGPCARTACRMPRAACRMPYAACATRRPPRMRHQLNKRLSHITWQFYTLGLWCKQSRSQLTFVIEKIK